MIADLIAVRMLLSADRTGCGDDPPILRRYAALKETPYAYVRRWLAEGVRLGQGFVPQPLVIGSLIVPITLTQACGYDHASRDQQLRWLSALARRDKTPALIGMDREGTRLLDAAASEWSGCANLGAPSC